MQVIRQVALVIRREKKKRRNPVIIAPNTLVAAKVIPRRITAVRIVPKIPARNSLKLRQQLVFSELWQEVKRTIPRKPTAIPNNTHRNAGVTVINAVNRKNAAKIPIITLAIMDFAVQLILQSQFDKLIYFTSTL